jgi:hypothetical protein
MDISLKQMKTLTLWNQTELFCRSDLGLAVPTCHLGSKSTTVNCPGNQESRLFRRDCRLFHVEESLWLLESLFHVAQELEEWATQGWDRWEEGFPLCSQPALLSCLHVHQRSLAVCEPPQTAARTSLLHTCSIIPASNSFHLFIFLSCKRDC